MIDEDDEAISLDHLIGEQCILNGTLSLRLRENFQKKGRLELASTGDTKSISIDSIDEMTADGGFLVTISSEASKQPRQMTLITAAQYEQQAKVTKKAERRHSL